MKNFQLSNTVYFIVFNISIILFNYCVYAQTYRIETQTIKKNIQSKRISDMTWNIDLELPILKGASEEVASAINSTLKKYSERYLCPNEGDNYFSYKTTLQNRHLLSFKFDIMFMCHSMPHPDSYSDGITFSLKSGKKIKLKEEVKSMKILKKAVLDEFGFRDVSCPETEFSGNYYLNADGITFIEFFPDHSDSGCEKEIKINYMSFSKYLKADSQLIKLMNKNNLD